MAVKREKVHFASVEELLGAPVDKDMTSEIRIDQIYPFENHPFKVLDDESMNELVESIRSNGVLVPVLVRPDDEGTYEMISGHRRMHAAKLAGLTTIPAIIKPMTNDEATIAMVDANMQREEILPSERAFSLKMKMEALKRQGTRTDLTSDQNGPKLASDLIGKEIGISGTQVKRFIRLTELIPDLLEYVDMKKITLSLAVEISFIDKTIQAWIYEYLKDNGFLKKEQIEAVRSVSNPSSLTQYSLIQLMNEALPKPKQKGSITFSETKLRKYFPLHYTRHQREEIMLQLLEEWSKQNNPRGEMQ
ncbi:chromosome partitioning protein, ParB family [Oribacterium sp. KHPX15]|uniref:ParB/RepB/Spo0J family partition protein n=1 Tax=Oribacterium sp. KHPX15 TaxID=1855342 RepID=UPI0008985F7D|nr:ParB/RepB/Spo0J family partition protein [Oribacterium sp. KHPX15]SEA18624.1 chromosome partitioning protein, ParB family [Oribacterium sp. KHPX15]